MVRIIRLLRLKHSISLVELKAVTGLSTQRLSQVELQPEKSTERQKDFMCRALDRVAAARKERAAALERDCLITVRSFPNELHQLYHSS